MITSVITPSMNRRLLATRSGPTLLVLLALLASALFSGCTRQETPSASPPVVTIRVAYRPKALADITPVIIAERHLSRPGLAIKLVPVSSPPDAMQKLDAGEVDAIAGIPF